MRKRHLPDPTDIRWIFGQKGRTRTAYSLTDAERKVFLEAAALAAWIRENHPLEHEDDVELGRLEHAARDWADVDVLYLEPTP